MSVTLTDWLATCPVVEESASATPAHSPFASLLRAYRERADISCNELARAVGVDPSYVSRMERDEREAPRRPVALALCQALTLEPDDADRLLIAAGYAPAWLLDAPDLPRLRHLSQVLHELAGALAALGVDIAV